MRLFSWIGKLLGFGDRPTDDRREETPLYLTRLEERQVLSVSVGVVGNNVTFTGNSAADTLNLSVDPSGNLQYNTGGPNSIDLDTSNLAVQSRKVSDITNLTINLGGGTDTLTFGGATPFNFSSGAANTITINSATEQTNVNVGVTAQGNQTYGNAVTLSGNLGSTTGTITFDQNVVLAADVTITGNVVFNGTVSGTAAGAQSLTISGNATFKAAVGTAVLPLEFVSVGGTAQMDAGSVTTAGNQTYTGAVTLGANTTLTSTTSGNINFASTVNGNKTLAVNTGGTTTFGGAVGATTALTSLTTNAAGTTAINGGSVRTSGAQTYNDPVKLGANTTLTADKVTFVNTVEGTSAGGQFLDIQGNAEFDGRVGNSVALASVNVTNDTTFNAAGTPATPTVKTSGTQQYGNSPSDQTTLKANTVLAATTVTFDSDVDGTTSGLELLDIQGSAVFKEHVGDTTALASLNVTNNTTFTATGNVTHPNVRTTGAQQYGDNPAIDQTIVQQNTVLTGTLVTFNSTVDGSAPGNEFLDIQASAIFNARVGNSKALKTLNVTGDTTFNAVGTVLNPTVKTTQTQHYGDNPAVDKTTLKTDTVLSATVVTFDSTIDGTTAGQELLDVQGSAIFNARVGNSTSLESVNVTGDTTLNAVGTVLTPSVKTAFTQTYGDNPTADATTLQKDTVLSGSTMTFNSTVDGTTAGQELLDVQGNAVFNARVGDNRGLELLNVTGNTTLNAAGATVTTTLTQTYGDNAAADKTTLQQDALLTGTTVTFNSTVDGTIASQQLLDVQGSAIFNAVVGNAVVLESVNITGNTTLNAAGTVLNPSVKTTFEQTYGDNPAADQTTLQKDTVLTGSTVTFDSKVDGTTAGQELLDVQGNAVFNARVGNAVALESVNVTGDTTLNAAGSSDAAPTVKTSGPQQYGDTATGGSADQTTLLMDTVLTSTGGSNVTFLSKVDGEQALKVNTAGVTRFFGQVGNTTPLASVTTNIGGTTQISGGLVVTQGNQTYNDPVVLTASATLTALTSAGVIDFEQTINGAFDLTLSGAGSAVAKGAVGTTLVPLGDGTGASLVLNMIGPMEFRNTVQTASGITQADTAGLVTFQENVTIAAGDTASTFNANVTLDGLTFQSSGAVTFGNTSSDQVTLSSGPVTIRTIGATSTLTVNAKLDGGQDLTLNTDGAALFNAEVGSGAPVGDTIGPALTINSLGTTTFASTLQTASGITQADTAGLVTFQENVTITAGDTDSTFNADVTLDGLTFKSAGNVTFGSATANEDTLMTSSALVTIDTSAAGKNVTVNAATTLLAPLTITTGAGDIVMKGTVNGNQAVIFNSSGTTYINGVVGGSTPVASLTTDADGTTLINSGFVSSVGNQTYNDKVVLGQDLAITTAGGNVTFASTLQSDATATPWALTIAAGTNDVTFNGIIGGNSKPLASITQTGGLGTTEFNGATLTGDLSIATNQIEFYNAAVTTNTDGGTGVSLQADRAVTFDAAADLDATAGRVEILANQGLGNVGFFTQDAGNVIRTSNTGTAAGSEAVLISVGGTGAANIAQIVTRDASNDLVGRITIVAGGAIVDNNDVGGPQSNLETKQLFLQAARIGDITAAGFTDNTLTNVAGNPIEITINDLLAAILSQNDSQLHLSQQGGLTLLPGTVILPGTAEAIIRATGDLDAGLPSSIDLFGNDNLGLIAGGKVTVPTAGFNTAVTGKPAGDLIMIGNDVVAFGNSRTMNFAANHLFFTSQAAGGDPLGSDILNTDLNKITVIFGNGTDIRNLTINEDQGAFPAAIDVPGLRGLNINVLKGDLMLKAGGTITDDDMGDMLDPMDITKTVDVHATNITLDVTGSALSSTQIAASEGKIDLRADANLTIKGSGVVLEVSGGNDVTGMAGGTVKIEAGAFIRSWDPAQPTRPGVPGQQPPAAFPGIVGTLPGDANLSTNPFAINVITPQITSLGEAEFHITFGQAGERNFTLTIDWADGTVETFTGLEGGVEHVFVHFYAADNLPDPSNPAAPIPIGFALVHDPNINFFDSRASTTKHFGSNDPNTTPNFTVTTSPPGVPLPDGNLDQINGVAIAGVPGEGLAVKAIDTRPEVELLTIVRSQSADTLVRFFEGSGTAEQVSEVRAAVADLVTNEEDALILEVLSPDGKVLERIVLRLDVLKDLEALYRRLPDGRYRLLLRRDGRELPIFPKPLFIRGQRLVDPDQLEDTQDKPPGGKKPGSETPTPKELSQGDDLSPADMERLWQQLAVQQAVSETTDAHSTSGVEAAAEDAKLPPPAPPPRRSAVQGVDKTPPGDDVEGKDFPRQASASAAGAAAVFFGLSTAKAQDPQQERTDEVQEPAEGKRPSKFARFLRRLKKWFGRGG